MDVSRNYPDIWYFPEVFFMFYLHHNRVEKKSDLANYKGDYEKKSFSFHRGQIVFFSKNMSLLAISEYFEVLKNAILQGKRSKWFFGPIRVKIHKELKNNTSDWLFCTLKGYAHSL